MAEPYRLFFSRSARRELERLRKPDIERVVKRLQLLATSPRPPGCRKLSDTLFRVRQGDYRILYEVDDQAYTVTILKIGHRREVYR